MQTQDPTYSTYIRTPSTNGVWKFMMQHDTEEEASKYAQQLSERSDILDVKAIASHHALIYVKMGKSNQS